MADDEKLYDENENYVNEDAESEASEDAESEAGEDAESEVSEDAENEASEDAENEASEDAESEVSEDAENEAGEDAENEAGEDAENEVSEDAESENYDEEETKYISLKSADGSEVKYEIQDVFAFEDKEYIALLPEGGVNDYYFYVYEGNDEESYLSEIEDSGELERVKEEFNRLKEETEYISLEFDNGSKVKCEILGVFVLGDKEYIALLPEGGTEDLYLYGYEETGDEFELTDIEDDSEFERAAKEFHRLKEEADKEKQR
ncbi:MAG: DUF1292 domain-containing protein [Clostridiales Family XIII bacterium]|jgi:hypothetical protein|nr:DUF1292 domain-containing protein [Clostridiales Family XIII bacterium]